MKKVSVHWTAFRLACRLLVRSVVNNVQAYWRFAIASMAMMQAASWRQRVAPGSDFCVAVITCPPGITLVRSDSHSRSRMIGWRAPRQQFHAGVNRLGALH